MKNKFFLSTVIACAFMFINCSDNTNKETTEISEDDETRVETVMTVSPSISHEHKTKGEPKAKASSLLDKGSVKYLAASSKTSPSYSMADAKFSKDISKVLKTVDGLHTSGKTVLGGRRGKSAGFSEGAAGSAGVSDGLAGLLGGSASMLSTSGSKTYAKKSSVVAKAAPRKSSERSVSSKTVYLASDSDESSSWDDDEPVTKRKRRARHSDEQASGLLTAGEWNDLEHWKFWANIINDNDYNGKMSYWKFYPQQLVAVKVVDGNDVAIANVPVTLLNGKQVEFTTKTDNAGYAYCWINLFNKYQNQKNDFWLIVDGVVINGQLKISSRNNRKLNINTVVDKDAQPAKTTADIAFIVDATGSMSDEIRFLKSDLNYIIDHASSESNVGLRTAALFYRDVGDNYLTRHDDFTDDVAKTQEFVSRQSANGGGDYPEAVHTALEASLQNLSWDEGARARIAFLILDAPAHYEEDIIKSLQKSIRLFAKKGIKLIPVAASGVDKETEFMLRFFDLATGGTYVFLTDDSGIGNSHIKATVGNYQVESLAELMIRLIKKYVE